MRYITLTEEEKTVLDKLEQESPNHITRLRCSLLKLSNKKLSMKKISHLKDVKWLRIVDFFNAWEAAKNREEKIKTLSIKKGRGAKVKLEPVKKILPKLLRQNNRNINIVRSILNKKYQINVCKITLQNFIQESKI